MVRDPEQPHRELPWWLLQIAIAALFCTGFGTLLLSSSFEDPWVLGEALPRLGHLGDSLRNGNFPGWWNGVGLGTPFAVQGQNAVFYPPAWIAALLSPMLAYKSLWVFHVWLGCFGVCLLSKRLGAAPLGVAISAAVFVLGGIGTSFATVGFAGWGTAWLPWIAVAVLRILESSRALSAMRRALLTSACIAMPLLLGDIATVVLGYALTIAIASAIYLRPKRSALLFALATPFMAAILAIAFLLPALVSDMSVVSPRLGESSLWSMLFPIASSMALAEWMQSNLVPSTKHLFLGTPGLFVILLWGVRTHRAGRLVLGMAALSALLIWQRSGNAFFPTFAGLSVLISSTVGVAVEGVFKRPLGNLEKVFILIVTATVCGLAWGLEQTPNYFSLQSREGLERLVFVAAMTSSALALTFMGKPESSLHRNTWMLLIWTMASVGLLGFRSNAAGRGLRGDADITGSIFSTSVLETAGQRSLSQEDTSGSKYPERLYRPASLPARPPNGQSAVETLMPNLGTLFGLSYVRGHNQKNDDALIKVWRAAGSATERLLDLLAVRFLVLPESIAIPSGMPVLARASGLALVENESRRPRAFVTSHVKFFPTEEALLSDLFPSALREKRGVHQATIRFAGVGSSSKVANQRGNPIPCEILDYRTNSITMDCQATGAGYAVLADRFDEGWSATVDGKTRTVAKADLLIRAIPIGAGKNLIKMRYQATGQLIAGIISGTAWSLFAFLLLYLRRKS